MYCFAFNDPAPHHHYWNHLTTITIVQNMESLEYHECCVDWPWSWKHEFYGNTIPCWWLYLWWGGGLTMTLMSHLALWILIGLYPTTLPQYNAATVTMGGERCHKRSRWHRGRIWTRSERVIGQHLYRHHQVVGCCIHHMPQMVRLCDRDRKTCMQRIPMNPRWHWVCECRM